MNTSPSSTPRAQALKRTIGALSLTLLFVTTSLPSVRGAGESTPPASAKALPKLPFKSNFSKVANSEDGPFVLKLKNTSKEAITTHVKILLSVAFHADSKARILPEHILKAGEEWIIPSLAADDKLIITADGHAPLELTVH